MADDLDDLLPPVPVPATADFTSDLAALSRFVPDKATPEERLRVLAIRIRLVDLKRDIEYALRSIDAAYLRSASETGAKQFLVAGAGPVKVAPPATSYAVKEQALYDALHAFVPDTLTEEEADAAIHREVSFKVNHSALNTLARNRGDAVRQTIERHRTIKPVSDLAGTVTHPKTIGGEAVS